MQARRNEYNSEIRIKSSQRRRCQITYHAVVIQDVTYNKNNSNNKNKAENQSYQVIHQAHLIILYEKAKEVNFVTSCLSAELKTAFNDLIEVQGRERQTINGRGE